MTSIFASQQPRTRLPRFFKGSHSTPLPLYVSTLCIVKEQPTWCAPGPGCPDPASTVRSPAGFACQQHWALPLLLRRLPAHHPQRTAVARHWWRMTGSNRRPPACKAGALPAELIPRRQPLQPTAPLPGPQALGGSGWSRTNDPRLIKTVL